MKQAVVESLLTSYEEAGKGTQTLVFLHGWGGDRLSLKSLWAELMKSHKIYSLDLPGFGSSQQPLDDWHVSDYANFVAGFVQSRLKGDYILIGHSFGGRVILSGVGSGVLKPQKIVLISAAGVAQRPASYKLYLVAAKLGKTLFSLPGLRHFQGFAQKRLYGQLGNTDYLYAGSMKKILTNTINDDLSGLAQKIVLPTLLLWGEKDTETPVVEGEKLHRLITDSKLEVLPRLGHFSFQQEPAMVADKIKDFLQP